VFPQIAPGDLDVAIIGQLPSSQLPFNRKLELDLPRFSGEGLAHSAAVFSN
jgi:hypothetical protein